jgi:hypothetical protein
MFKNFKKSKGQSTLEYAILIIIIIGALLSIQVYIKRGVQGRLKQASDDIGDQFAVGNTNQIRRTVTNSVTLDQFGVAKQGVSRSQLVGAESTLSGENTVIHNTEQEFWGSN